MTQADIARPVAETRRFLAHGEPALGEEEIREVVETLRGGWLGRGPRVVQLELAFALYKGGRRAVAVSSGTAAMHLSLLAAGVQPGDEVLTTAMTFAATLHAILLAGATPLVCDVEPGTHNIDPQAVERAITPRTRFLLPVHFAGRCCDMARLTPIAEQHGLIVVEDCAHAIEASFQGRPAGTLGDFGCFSFSPSKNVTGAGGGMVLVRDEETAHRVHVLAHQGLDRDAWSRNCSPTAPHYLVVDLGHRYEMTDVQAAIAVHQLARAETNHARRTEIWHAYQEAFAGLPVELPPEPPPGSRHARHLYRLLVDEHHSPRTRDELIADLHARGIGAGVHYLAIPEHPFFRQALGCRLEDAPVAVDAGRRTLTLPLSPALTTADVDRVVDAVTEILGA